MSSNIEQLKQDAKKIEKGLFQLGRRRIAALPVHSTLDLIDDLEMTVHKMLRELDKLNVS